MSLSDWFDHKKDDDGNSILPSYRQLVKHFRWENPHIPILTIPDFAQSFQLSANQQIQIPLQREWASINIGCSVDGSLIVSFSGITNSLSVVSAANAETLSQGFVNNSNHIYIGRGVNGISFLNSSGSAVNVSIKAWS